MTYRKRGVPYVKRWPSLDGKSGRKYRNKPVEVDGIKFDSADEARRYGELKQLERAGVILNLVLQPRYKLQSPDGKYKCLTTPSKKRGLQRVRVYTPDFEYTDAQTALLVTEDVKGFIDETAKLRIAVFEMFYGRKVTIIKYRS